MFDFTFSPVITLVTDFIQIHFSRLNFHGFLSSVVKAVLSSFPFPCFLSVVSINFFDSVLSSFTFLVNRLGKRPVRCVRWESQKDASRRSNESLFERKDKQFFCFVLFRFAFCFCFFVTAISYAAPQTLTTFSALVQRTSIVFIIITWKTRMHKYRAVRRL